MSAKCQTPNSATPKSVISTLRQSGSLKCLFPRTRPDTLQAVLVNTAGGITGGDRYTVSGHVESGAALTMTTQACERAYRASAGQTGRVDTRLSVAANARLNWLPQETILFDGASFERRLDIDLDAPDLLPEASAAPSPNAPPTDTRLLMVEPVVFGRDQMGETLRDARFHDTITIRRNGVPLYADALRLSGDIQARLDRPFVADGARAMASLVYVARDAAAHLDAIRAALPQTAGASLIGEDLLVARFLAPDSYLLRATLMPVLSRLTGDNLPRCWSI